MITNKTIVRIAVIVQMILCAESQLQASSWWGNADAQSTSRGETDAQFIARMQEKLKSAPVVSQEEREYKNYLDPEDFDKSGQLIHPSRRYLIADIDKKYPEYKEGFRVIGRGDNGFYNFLQENLSYDENKDEASNAEQVLIDAKEKIINGLKNSFIRGFKEDNPRFVQDNFNTLYNSKTIDDLNRAIDSIFLLSRINNLKKLRDQKIDYVVKYSGVNLKINHSFLKDQIQEWIRDQILNYGFSLLDWAIATKKVEKVKLFLDAGANIDRQDDYGYTALMMAVANNNPEIVELLLAAHPNINLQNKSGDTALHLAKSASIERMLLDAGANLDIRNKKDQTPTIKFDNKPNLASSASEYKPNKGDNTTLMGIAVAENRSEMVEPLLADHPNVNLQDKSGNTALHYAKNLSIANMLLNADADRNIRNNDDQTAAERINLVGKQGALSRHISQYKPKK